MKRIIVNVTEEQYEEIRKVSFSKKQSMSATVRNLLITLEKATPMVRELMAEKLTNLTKELKDDADKINKSYFNPVPKLKKGG